MAKTISARVVHKHDLEAHWLRAKSFVPIQGEFIIYDIEVDSSGNTLELPEKRTEPYKYERFKIGDGKTPVNELPFSDEHIFTGLSTVAMSGSYKDLKDLPEDTTVVIKNWTTSDIEGGN